MILGRGDERQLAEDRRRVLSDRSLSMIEMKEMCVGLAVAILIDRGGARGSASMRP